MNGRGETPMSVVSFFKNIMDNADKKEKIIFSLLITYLFICFCVPVEEVDFFWHFSTGEWILNNGKLPDVDPFSKLYSNAPDIRDTLILKGYWLSQIIYALLWQWMGAFGIVFLRASLLCGIFYLIYKTARKDGSFLMAIIAFIPILVDMRMQIFLGERPQQFTFLFFCLLYYLLNKNDDHFNHKKYLPIIFLMTLWANVHPGVVVGILLLGLYAISLTFYWYKKKIDRDNYLKNIFCITLCIAASMINPNSWRIFHILFEPFFKMSSGMKYYLSFHLDGMSVYQLFVKQGVWQFYGFIFVFLFGLITLGFKAKKIQPFHLLLLLALFCLAINRGRYMVFLTMLGLPLVLPYWKSEWDRVESVMTSKILVPLVLTSLLLVGGWVVILQGSAFVRGPLQEDKYPKAAVEFIKNSGLSGNIFNPYGWGGYLIAFLPGHEIFLDGRGLGANQGGHVIESAFVVQAVSYGPGGKPMWKSILEQRDIKIFIAEISENWSKINKEMLNDPGWELVFQDQISYVFLRR